MKIEVCAPSNPIYKFAHRQNKAFKWNGLLAFFNESYLLLCFCSAYNILAAANDPSDQVSSIAMTANSLIAFITTAAVVIVPIVLTCALYKHWSSAVKEANAHKGKPFEKKVEGTKEEPKVDEKTREADYQESRRLVEK